MTSLRDLKRRVDEGDFEAWSIWMSYRSAEYAIRAGTIPTFGKTDADLRSAIKEYLKNLVVDDSPISEVPDYREHILERATAFAHSGDLDDSILYYATWFEHWINDLLTSVARRRQMEEAAIGQMIRSANVGGKYTWLVAAFGLPALDTALVADIDAVASIRNSYIHYKFAGQDPDQTPTRQEKLRDAIEKAERAVPMLLAYEERQLIGAARQVLLACWGLEE